MSNQYKNTFKSKGTVKKMLFQQISKYHSYPLSTQVVQFKAVLNNITQPSRCFLCLNSYPTRQSSKKKTYVVDRIFVYNLHGVKT